MTDQEREEFEFRLRMEQESEAERGLAGKIEDVTGVDVSSPLFGAAMGTIAGPFAGSLIEGATKGAQAPLPGPSGVGSGRAWYKGYVGIDKPNLVGGVPDAAATYQRSKGHGPVSKKVTQRYGPDAKLDIASYSAKQRARPFSQKMPEFVQRIGQGVQGGVSRVPPWLGRGVAGGSAGYQGVDALNRIEQDDYLGGAISGLGALGSAAAMVPHPIVRGIGTAVAAGAPMLNEFIDRLRKDEQPKEYAKGRSVKAGLDLLVGKETPAISKIKDQAMPLWQRYGYDPKRVSQQYPEVAPPEMATDPKTGKTFAQKQLSQEALAVQKARQAAQKEIESGMMDSPFFDISKRAYVDPSNYPLPGRTLTSQVPKKAETVEKYRAIAEGPEATQRLLDAYRRGSQAPMAKDWYAMKQLEDEFIKELGPEAGRTAFRQRFAEPMAATTGGADPTSNLMMTAYSNYMDTAGKTLPTAAFELPFPVGGRFVSGNMEQANRYRQAGAIPIDNPKRHNFASNFMGYRDRPTIDEQMMGLFAPGKGAPEPGTYGVYESALNKLAAQEGVNPVNFQDVAWAGAKNYQGKPMMQEINEMIYRTGRITGEAPEDVLRGFIRGNKPMYGITGLGALGMQETGGVNNPE